MSASPTYMNAFAAARYTPQTQAISGTTPSTHELDARTIAWRKILADGAEDVVSMHAAVDDTDDQPDADVEAMQNQPHKFNDETDVDMDAMQDLNNNLDDKTDVDEDAMRNLSQRKQVPSSASVTSASSIEEPLMAQWKRAKAAAAATGAQGVTLPTQGITVPLAASTSAQSVRARKHIDYREATQDQLTKMFSLEDKLKGKNKGKVFQNLTEFEEIKGKPKAYRAGKKTSRGQRITGHSRSSISRSAVQTGRITKPARQNGAVARPSSTSGKVVNLVNNKNASSPAVAKARKALKGNAANNYRAALETGRETMEDLASEHEMDADEQARVEAALILMNMINMG